MSDSQDGRGPVGNQPPTPEGRPALPPQYPQYPQEPPFPQGDQGQGVPGGPVGDGDRQGQTNQTYGQPYGGQGQPYGQPGQPYGQPYSQPYGPEQPYAQGPAYGQPYAQGAPGYGQPSYGDQPYGQPGQGPQIPQGAPQMPAYGGQGPYGGYGAAYPAGWEPPIWAPWYGISFLQTSKRFFTKFCVFNGRASRGEFWWSVLLFVFLNMFLGLIDSILPDSLSALVGIIELVLLVPLVAVFVRRLHDANLSGWWALLTHGCLVLGLILFVQGDGMSYANDPYALPSTMASTGSILCLVWLVSTLVLSFQSSNPNGSRFDRPV